MQGQAYIPQAEFIILLARHPVPAVGTDLHAARMPVLYDSCLQTTRRVS